MSILITGANRGIGLRVAQTLAKSGKNVIFAGRDEESVQKLSSEYKNSTFVKLDVSNKQSIEELPQQLQHKGVTELSVLVNNAAINKSGWDELTLNETLQTNLHGPINLINTLLPLIQKGGKIINVSSGMGQLENSSSTYRNKILQTNNLEEVLSIKFEEDEEIKLKYSPTYSLSKALLNRATQFIAKDEKILEKEIKVSVVCPGWCKTDMGGGGAPRDPQQGADSILWLVNHENLPTGSFFRDGEVLPW